MKKINHVNKELQKEYLTVDKAAKHVEGLLNFVKASRDYSSSEAITEAKFLADKNNVLGKFTEKRK